MCLATVYKNPENTVVCKNVSRSEVHNLVDEIYDYYTRKCRD